MICTSDEYLKIKYNERKNILKIKETNRMFRERKIVNKIYKSIVKNKFISIIILFLIIFSIANIIMLYNFMNILQNI